MPNNMSESMSYRMFGKMPEYMSKMLSWHAMVGTTRSKVFSLLCWAHVGPRDILCPLLPGLFSQPDPLASGLAWSTAQLIMPCCCRSTQHRDVALSPVVAGADWFKGSFFRSPKGLECNASCTSDWCDFVIFFSCWMIVTLLQVESIVHMFSNPRSFPECTFNGGLGAEDSLRYYL